MEITQAQIPENIQLFENLLWANSPKDWVLKSTYHKKTLFVSISTKTSQKIRRSFSLSMIRQSRDLWNFAAISIKCINEMIQMTQESDR